MEPQLYRPGAGHQPPYLAGRDAQLIEWRRRIAALAEIGRAGTSDTIFTGPRGIGKTVLMTACANEARAVGYEVINYQAAEGNDGLIASIVKNAARHVDAGRSAWQRAKHAFENLAGVSFGVAGVSASLSLREAQAERFSRDPGDLAYALASLAAQVSDEHRTGGVLIAIDELQVAPSSDLTLLAAALQRLNVEHPDAHVAFVATALPHITEVLEEAGVTHPDRLFKVEPLPRHLDEVEAAKALTEPALAHGVRWEQPALDAVLQASGGYPSHLQLLAAATWTLAPGPGVITAGDAAEGVTQGISELRTRSLEPRWEAMRPSQREFIAAVAAHGGEATTAQLVATLDVADARGFSRVREELLRRGDITAPRRGVVAIATPAMTDYILDQLASHRQQPSPGLPPADPA